MSAIPWLCPDCRYAAGNSHLHYGVTGSPAGQAMACMTDGCDCDRRVAPLVPPVRTPYYAPSSGAEAPPETNVPAGALRSDKRSRVAVAASIERVFNDEIKLLYRAGQAEYAHDRENAFANFERQAEEQGITPEQVLCVFARKHWDGIVAFVRGHKSQREDVRGRINDLIVYLHLLRAMIDAGEEA